MSLQVCDTTTISGHHSVLTDTYVRQLEEEFQRNPLLVDQRPSDKDEWTRHGSFTAMEVFKSRAARLWSRFVRCKYSKRKIPTDKPVIVLLFLCYLQRVAFFALTMTLGTMYYALGFGGHYTSFFFTGFIEHCLSHLMYPLAGWAGDVYLGRVRAIYFSLLLLFAGYGAMTLECALYYYYSSGEACVYLGVVMTATYLITAVGEALFQANMIPYGADLIMYECSSTEISSYFYWYYWVRNLSGPFLLILAVCNLGVSQPLFSVMSSAIAVISLTLALVFFFAMRSSLPTEKIKTNPYKTAIKILFYAARVKRPKSKSAFGFGKDPPPRIDLAKWRHGGKFDNEEVEDVKTVWRLLLIMIAITALFISLTMTLDVTMLQSLHFKSTFLENYSYCDLNAQWVWVINTVCIIIIIPLLELVIFPILGEFTPSMLKRIGICFFLLLIASFSQLTIELGAHHNNSSASSAINQCMFSNVSSSNKSDMSPGILVVPILLGSVAEVGGNVPGLTFLYAQSPCNMRGMMTGLFFFLNGMFSFIGYCIMGIFSLESVIDILSRQLSCGFWYFVAVMVISIVLFVIYTVLSLRYKNRDRGELETKEPYYFRYKPVFLQQWRES